MKNATIEIAVSDLTIQIEIDADQRSVVRKVNGVPVESLQNIPQPEWDAFIKMVERMTSSINLDGFNGRN
jgi:hypothetical protein